MAATSFRTLENIFGVNPRGLYLSLALGREGGGGKGLHTASDFFLNGKELEGKGFHTPVFVPSLVRVEFFSSEVKSIVPFCKGYFYFSNYTLSTALNLCVFLVYKIDVFLSGCFNVLAWKNSISQSADLPNQRPLASDLFRYSR